MKRILTRYELDTGKLKSPLHFAIVSDLHNERWEDILPLIEGADALLIPGDLADRYCGGYQQSIAFLKECTQRFPVFMSMGNHDLSIDCFAAYMNALRSTEALLLFEDYALFHGIAIAGRYRPYEKGLRTYASVKANPKRIKRFEELAMPKILLCHKPEQFQRFGQNPSIDLTIAGHAHGGQVRILNQGIYSPGQGFFPKLTHGMELPRLLVTSGAGNPVHMPRWGNPCEVVMLTFS